MDRENGRGPRRRFSPELKMRAIQEARQGGVPISRVCEKYGIRPAQFYQWEKRAEQGALQALRQQRRGRKRLSPREEELAAEIGRLREVIAEISAENLALKKGRWR
jgi:transposase-like protein